MQTWPLLDELENLDEVETVLLAGAGGGFDVYHAIPLYFRLVEMGKKVVFCNYSFASLASMKSDSFTASCVRVHADSSHSASYAPEYTMCRWFREVHQQEVSIYAYRGVGVVPVKAVFNKLKKKLGVDAVVIVDGGTDSLMRGDEFSLATPAEDMTSIVAAYFSNIDHCYLMCIGFGVDTYHGVSHAQYLESVAALSQTSDFLGVSSLLPQSVEFAEYSSLINYANDRLLGNESIVANSIESAAAGKYGDVNLGKRTQGSKLWINPLMAICWGFRLNGVIERSLYAKRLEDTEKLSDVEFVIRRFRMSVASRDWESIPH